jgi:hypothetical protein
LEEQHSTQSELSQLVHEFQRERIVAHEWYQKALVELNGQHESLMKAKSTEHFAELEAVESRLRAEYEATVARLGSELAASYSAQLERLLAARDNDVSREYATLGARVQETLQETSVATQALQSRASDLDRSLTSLQGEHGNANEALQLATSLVDLHRAVSNSVSLEEPLNRAQAAAVAFPSVHVALSSISTIARSAGVVIQSPAALSAQLSALEPAARRASDSSASSKLKEWLVQPPAGLVQGDDAGSILARARFHAERGALASALSEINGLPQSSQEVLKDWRNQASARVQVEEAIALAEAHVASHARSFAQK